MKTWTAAQHREDAKLVQAAMQRIAQRRLDMGAVRRTPEVYIPLDDASDLLMALHRDGLYAPELAASAEAAWHAMEVDLPDSLTIASVLRWRDKHRPRIEAAFRAETLDAQKVHETCFTLGCRLNDPEFQPAEKP